MPIVQNPRVRQLATHDGITILSLYSLELDHNSIPATKILLELMLANLDLLPNS